MEARDVPLSVMEEGGGPAQGASRSGCFPFEPFKCLPAPMLACVPGTCRKIQDATHLTLILGVTATFVFMGRAVVLLWQKGCDSSMCYGEILTVCFILPCMLYCLRIIGQYDDRLQSKQLQVKKEKANLTRTYNDLLADMDGLLTKSAESSAGLAERSFESKRRDFQRFLERAKQRYGAVYTGMKGESDQLLREFRRFCINWLHVFEECSIDPIHHPKRVVMAEELNRCTSIGEVADLCLERLRVTEVRFISMQRDQDAQMLRKNRNDLRRVSSHPSAGRLALPAPATVTTSTPAPRGMTWLAFGGGFGCRCSRNPGEDGFPRECRFGCGRLVILSSQHLQLLLGLLVGCVVIGIEVARFIGKQTSMGGVPEPSATLVATCLAQVCLIVMLCRFEELDTIQQLEREVKELTRQNQQVEQQREKMNEFWNNAQQLTDLWLHRTVPRLDLYKEIHSQLEDAPSEDLLVNIAGANQHLEDLDRSLGPLESWRGDGSIGIDDKKLFGKAVNQLCQEREFDEILVKLEQVSGQNLKHFLALPPSRPSFSGSKS